MAYKYGTKDILKSGLNPVKDFWVAALESYKTSKKIFILQTMNWAVCSWITLYVIPQIIFDIVKIKIEGPNSALLIVLGFFIKYAVEVMAKSLSAINIGFKTMFEMKEDLTIMTTIISFFVLISYYVWYKELKKDVKVFLQSLNLI